MKNQMTISEIRDLVNQSNFNARNKKAAAKFVSKFEGYETARPNTNDEFGPSIFIELEEYVSMSLLWDAEDKYWYVGNSSNSKHTPSDAVKARIRRVTRRKEDKLVDHMGRNRKIISYYYSKKDKIQSEIRKLDAQIRQLKSEYYKLPW
jgi:hypothetical protein